MGTLEVQKDEVGQIYPLLLYAQLIIVGLGF